eukprot:gb/GECH01007962.1/.p1 GENE.gb/GECH01007962.1/~~gb/GECH01007962.1/.p1  ORF type:complete len:319 (+),score=80.31 gb/GECH01007962.1/:1-957(+)
MTRSILQKLVNKTRGMNGKDYARISFFDFEPQVFRSSFTTCSQIKTLRKGNNETKTTLKNETGDMITFYKALFPSKLKETVDNNEYLKSEPWWYNEDTLSENSDNDDSNSSDNDNGDELSKIDENSLVLSNSDEENMNDELFFSYTASIHDEINNTSKTNELKTDISVLNDLRKWVILLCHGGYFAGAVFNQGNLITHKTFHRYVTRKKSGQRQSTRDHSGKKPKSVGSNIRRWNEAKHEAEIRDLLQNEWKQYISEANAIFLHSPGRNSNLFFYSGSPLSRKDTRIRGVPFSTRKPTLSEVKKSFQELATVEIFLAP